MNMELGTAKRVITPPRPVRLAGYATRTTPFDSVLEDILCPRARLPLRFGPGGAGLRRSAVVEQ